ncbi:MAG TPA: RNA-binding cell elongation regulator Jag/EloR [Dehalococcoidia bacterium]|nr:RNA-binding cell elongation regulator Jag/EloR [Dehalococcoidia bacterium]
MAETPDPTERGQGAIEASGRNVEEAIRRGLADLGIDREQAEIEVLSEGRPGILGVGAQPARVRIAAPAKPQAQAPRQPAAPPAAPFPEEEPEAPASPPARPRRTPRATAKAASAPAGDAPEAPLDDAFVKQGADTPRQALALDADLIIESAVDALETLLSLMDVDAEVAAREPVTPGDGAGMITAVLDVTGVDDEEQGLIIGRRGETLAALQYLLNLIVNHQTRSHSLFGVDVEGYRRRRETALGDLARRVAERVRQNGQAMTLEPMPPAERRIVHLALSEDPDVETISIGEGEARKVAITPKR